MTNRNIFAAGGRIVEALHADHAPAIQIFEAGGIGDVMDRLEISPAFHVMYGLDNLTDGIGQPVVAAKIQPRIDYQVWDVACVCRDLGQQYGGGSLLLGAGELVGKVIATVKATRVEGAKPFRAIRLSPYPHELEPGTALYIVSFEITLPFLAV